VEDLQRIGTGNRAGFAAIAALALAIGGCGSEPSRDVPAACKSPAAVVHALGQAPEGVRIGARRLSDCFVAGADAADVEGVGLAFLPVVQRLAGDPRGTNAVRLGFLVGAVRRGVAGGKVYAELGHRIEQELIGVDTSTPGFRRGLRAGLRSG
jgi:hypothetical protein